MMKTFRVFAFFILTAALLFTLTACGDSPKSLAKQRFNVYMEMMDAMHNKESTEKINEKIEILRPKLEKLEGEKKEIYEAELKRLFDEAMEKAAKEFYE